MGLSGVMARAKGFWRGYPQMGIQSVELRPSRLPSLHIIRISDPEALTEVVSCCATSEGLIEEGNVRKQMREMTLSPRCLYARRRFTFSWLLRQRSRSPMFGREQG